MPIGCDSPSGSRTNSRTMPSSRMARSGSSEARYGVLSLPMLSIAWLLAGCPEDPARVNDHVYEILELNQRKELEISRLRQELTASKAALGQLRKEVELSRQAGTLGGNDVVALLEEKRRLEQRVQDQQEFLTFCRERTFTLERENLELREQDEAFFTAA